MISTGLFSNRGIQFLRDLLSLFFAQVVVKVVGFVAFAYLARNMSHWNYGAIEVVISLTGLGLLLVDFGLGRIGVRELNLHRDDGEVANEIPSIRFLIALVCFPVLIIGTFVNFEDPAHRGLAVFFGLTLFAMAWNQEWYLQAREQINRISVGQTLRTLTFATLVFLFVKGGDDVLWVGIAELVSVALWVGYLLYSQIGLGVRPGWVFHGARAKGFLTQSTPLGVSAFAWGVAQFVPPIVVAFFSGLAEAAILAVAQRIVTSLQTVNYIYHFAFYTALIERFRQSVEALRKLIRASIRVLAWAAIGPAVVCAVYGSQVMVLIFGDTYSDAGLAFGILIFTIPFHLSSGHQRWTLTTIGEQKAVLVANLTGAATAVVGSILVVPFYGAVGAAVASVLATVATWVAATILCRHKGVEIDPWFAFARPTLAAVLACMAVSYLPMLWWQQAVLALALYYAMTPIFDRKFLPDLRHVAYAKSHLAEADDG
ncbi:MAG: oligosaccharide flippase family protein [Marinibacterium sp.]